LEKLIGGGKTIIYSVDIDLSYKIFVLSMLHTFFMHPRQIAKGLILSMSPLERSQFNDLVAECKKILNGMGKILESMTFKVAQIQSLQSLSSLKLLKK